MSRKMYGGVEEAKKDIYKYFGRETTSMMTIILTRIILICCHDQRWMELPTIIFGGRNW